MAMFEVEGKSKITVSESTTTDPTLIRSTGEESELIARVKNCHAGTSISPAPDIATSGILKKSLEWILENSITLAFTLASGALLAYFGLR